MKKSRTTAFAKARIEEVDGELLIIEVGKKDEEIVPDDMIEDTVDEFIED